MMNHKMWIQATLKKDDRRSWTSSFKRWVAIAMTGSYVGERRARLEIVNIFFKGYNKFDYFSPLHLILVFSYPICQQVMVTTPINSTTRVHECRSWLQCTPTHQMLPRRIAQIAQSQQIIIYFHVSSQASSIPSRYYLSQLNLTALSILVKGIYHLSCGTRILLYIHD